MGLCPSRSSGSSARGGGGNEDELGLGDIPESCIARVFLFLTPPEICNLARVSRAFRSAASSDAVWESKLPPNYNDLLELLPPERCQNLSKKDLFALLSRPVPFDDGKKEMWVDKVTGRVCMSISAKAMTIIGIQDRKHWAWMPTEESRFHAVAFLLQIWWFEVAGAVKFPLPPDSYTVSFRLHLGGFCRLRGQRVCHLEFTHGWEIKPARFELTTSDGQQASSEYNLNDIGDRVGLWIDYKVGELAVSHSNPAIEIRFSAMQTDCTHSKGGLWVDSVSIIPNNLR